MHFAEAEQRYRELEDKLLNNELTEDQFLAEVNQLRVTDDEGRRWMLSGRTGRWLVYDGQQWVYAEPSKELVERAAEATPTGVKAGVPAARPPQRTDSRSTMPRLLAAGVLGLLLIGCVVAAGVSAWVLVLRDLGQATPIPTEATLVSLVETYTPRPATPTYTPTPTPTATRTPIPTDTPFRTDTPSPTPTSPPPTPLPTLAGTDVSSAAGATSTPTWTPIAVARTPTATPVALSPTPTASSATSTASPTRQVSHVVEAGDTLWEIASRYGVSVDALARANGITDTTLIRPGQVLTIPVPGVTSVAAVTSPTPTWTPIVVSTPRTTATSARTATPTPSRSPTPTPTRSGPTSTPRPTNTPRPAPTPTQPPRSLSGKIAFTVWNPYLGKYELYVSRIDGSGRNRIGEGFRQPQFRQDGNLLAANGDGAPDYEHMVKMNPGGGELVEVSNYVEDSFPTWSPDGNIVAYSSSSWGDGFTRLGIVHDMFGKKQNWIPIGTLEIRGEYPFWMADGRVVYHGCDFLVDHAACGLYWVGAGGGNYHRLTNHNSDTAPTGYGSRVAFMSARDGNWEVYTVNMDGSGLQRLTNNTAQDGLPTWSPDGRAIAFVSNRSGAWAIWVMDANGNNQRKLFDLDGGYGSGNYDWTSERISWAP